VRKIERILENLKNLPEYRVSVLNRRILRLDRNENFVIPKEVVQTIINRALRDVDLRRYPDEEVELYHTLADFLDVHEDQLVIGSGEDDIIYKTSLAFLGRGGEAIIVVPTFEMYKWAVERVGGTSRDVLLNEGFSLNVERVLEAYNERTNLIFLCSPNNPTGNSFSEQAIRTILDSVDCAVIIDEAYYYFSNKSLISLLNENYENLIIMRTFSKIGFAGIRLGYLVASKKVASIVRKFVMPYSINTFSLLIGMEIIRNFDLIQESIGRLIKERERLANELKKFNQLLVYNSETNFLLVRLLEGNVKELIKQLMDKGIAVRDVSKYPLLANCFRVTVGNAKMNDSFLRAIKEILE